MEGNSSRACSSRGAARLGLTGQCALLALVTLVSYSMAAAVAFRLHGPVGCLAAGVAALLPLAGAEMAILASRLGDAPSTPLRGMLFGMLLRLGVPLAGSLVIRLRGGQMLEAGALYYLILFYLVTLATEVGFEVCQVPSNLPDRRAAQG